MGAHKLENLKDTMAYLCVKYGSNFIDNFYYFH